MRNIRTAIVPPNAKALIDINPPMNQAEQPNVLTLNKLQLEIEINNPYQVTVTNRSDVMPLPIYFFVGPKNFTLNGFVQTIRQLLLPKGP
jgi:hypothetical protein